MGSDRTGAGMQDFDGTDVVDSNGDTVGAVERTYDDGDGVARLVEVKIGALFSKHRLVPLDGAESSDKGIQVPYDKHMIEGSPDAGSAADTLEGSFLDSVMAYYGENNDGSDTADAGVDEVGAVPAGEAEMQTADDANADQSVVTPISVAETGASSDNQQGGALGAVRDLGDVIEVPIVEEVLVKRPVVKEVLRIRKRQITEQQTVEGDVRTAEVEVIDVPDSSSSGEAGGVGSSGPGETDAESPRA
jgi:hypothetical protein